MMEMAKVTSKGQITIPITIRRRLSINEGDKILFIDKPEGVMMVNPDIIGAEQLEAVIDAAEVETMTTPSAQAAPQAVAQVAQQPVQTVAEVAEIDFVEVETAPPPPPPPAPPPEPRRYIPPVEEEYEEPAPKQAGGVDLSTLLDDFRSIGSLD
ncbi:MAG: AbrB/MazE/SpoVT family DNA-binding domain-containing protein [Oscillospiraceae bacterium]|jgi:AbrB family looped-hinge helix DNA binding protein|nr:AbrB/MazE/SpoVT family DNA-binding domain-containing protein [Oscillospiraceae bacterium]